MKRPPLALFAAVLCAAALLHPRGSTVDGAPPAAPAAPVAGPGGMVYVDVGEGGSAVSVGTDAAEVAKLVGGRKDFLLQFLYESPRHKHPLRPYFIDATEVSNAQYLVFLDQTARAAYRTGSSALSNLFEIGSFYVFGDARKAETERDDRTWAQLYELNRAALEAAVPALKGQKAKWKLASLPPDLDLVAYRRRLPEHWFDSSGVLEGDAGPDMPVRSVSYLDASAFGEWAGKHVPDEAEWEWAARGPDGRTYPWGDDWTEGQRPDGERIVEKRCNWLDLKVVNAKHEPTTLPVEDLPEGRSWCGCHHMLGNVAEWTSSWFKPYPGWVDPADGDAAKNPYLAYHDDYVRVIRGASCADRERLVLRLAARNFVGNGRLAPPVPENRFTYVGFRCAWYMTPGLDRLEPTVGKLLRPQKIRADQVARDRFAGSMAVHHAPAGAAVENHVFVTGGSAAVILAPLTSLSARLPPEERARAHSPSEILAATKEEEPVVLGVFHVDVGIDRARVPAPRKEEANKPASLLRKRHQEVPEPPTVDGTIPADSYLVGLWHGKVALFSANLTFVGFIGLPKDKSSREPAPPAIEARKLKKDEPPPASSISVDAEADFVKCSMWIPIGGKGSDPSDGVTISWSFATEAGAIAKAGSWR